MNGNHKKAISLYFNKKMKPSDIAKELNISKSAITQILQRDERYNSEKEVRKEQNRKKHIENTKEYIKKQRNLNQIKNKTDDLILKKLHKTASIELSKRKKLSNIAYRDWNTSAYIFNKEKNRFEFRKELGRSYDVPQYIK